MILGTASGLPVVACVATKDRWNHMLDCPYCNEVHSHGGWGQKSPAGAANGGRLAHCRVRSFPDGTWDDSSEVNPDERFYVLIEVPGLASFGVRCLPQPRADHPPRHLPTAYCVTHVRKAAA